MLKDVLKQLRLQNGLRQEEMAKLINISRPGYAKYESGASKPDYDTLCRFADYFNVTVDYLLERESKTFDIDALRMQKLYCTANHQSRQIAKYCLEIGQITPAEDISPNIFTIDYYPDCAASAGRGNMIYDVPVEKLLLKKTPPAHASFVVRVQGDSMTPEYNDKDKVFVRGQIGIEQGQIGVFLVDGDVYIKKAGEGELISLNPAYKNIRLSDFCNFTCFGVVLGKCDSTYLFDD